MRWPAYCGLRRQLQVPVTRAENAARPHAESSWAPRAVRVGRAASEQPLPWLIAMIVFVVNSVLSGVRGDWILAAFELVTGVLAGMSAVAAASRRPSEPSGIPIDEVQRRGHRADHYRPTAVSADDELRRDPRA